MQLIHLYIIISIIMTLDLLVYDIICKRPSIVSIYIIAKIMLFSIILYIIHLFNIDFAFKVVTTIFTAWIDINFLINAIINLMYKRERNVKNITLEIIYIIISIAVIVGLFILYKKRMYYIKFSTSSLISIFFPFKYLSRLFFSTLNIYL